MKKITLALDDETYALLEKDRGEMSQQKYLFIDKTGRGFTNNELTKNDLSTWDDQDYYGDPLENWLEDSTEGDEWENAEFRLVCIGEN